MDDRVVKIENLRKRYRLGVIGGGTLQADVQSFFARLQRKEDPNSKLLAKAEHNEDFWALDGVNLEIHRGDRIGIIGKNGAGKSTLLKILAKITTPTEGCIYVRGKIASVLEVGTGFHKELTGRENIYLNGAILGMKKKEIAEKIEEIIEFAEIGEFIDTPVKRYSSGMYVKLAFSVAAHLNADILIMDEVLAVGDVGFQEKCIRKMRELVDTEQKTILYVSHNMRTVNQLCNKGVVMNKGKIQYFGEAEQAIQIYYNINFDSGRTHVGLSERKRSSGFVQKIAMKSFEFCRVQNTVFHSRDPIACEIGYEVLEAAADVCLRVTVRYNGDPILTYLSQRFGSFQKDGMGKLRFLLDIEMLAGGVYVLDVGLYERNAMGLKTPYDYVRDAATFQVIQDGVENSNWNHRYCGSVICRAEIIENKRME